MRSTSLFGAALMAGAALARRAASSNSTAVENPNFGGAVVSNNGTIINVAGIITVPTVESNPENTTSSLTLYGQAAVSIDAYNCSTGSVQAGVQWTVSPSGDVKYSAFYEAFPNGVIPVNVTVNAGDRVGVSALSEGIGYQNVAITNYNNGQQVSIDISNSTVLCQASAAWIVEYPLVVPSNNTGFADFGEVIFSNATYTIGSTDPAFGQYGPEDATLVYLVTDGDLLAVPSIESVGGQSVVVVDSY